MKKTLTILLALVLIFALAACGSKEDKSSGEGGTKEETKTEEAKTEETQTEEKKEEAKDGAETKEEPSPEDRMIKVGATPKPHAEILEQAKKAVEEAGYELQIIEFDDYVLPNTALEEGELDANFFQHITYMNNFNETNGTHLVEAAKIHYEPFAIYSEKIKSLEELKEGAQVAIPNDDTNSGRALLLLAENKLIRLKEGVGLKPSEADIVDNPKNIKLVATEARLLPTVLQDVELAIINGNYAIDAGLKVSEALAIENAEGTAGQAYVNIISVKEGSENSAKIKALVEALTTAEVKGFIEETYGGAVKAVF